MNHASFFSHQMPEARMAAELARVQQEVSGLKQALGLGGGGLTQIHPNPVPAAPAGGGLTRTRSALSRELGVDPMVLEEVRRAVPSFGVAELHGLLHGYDDDRNCVAHAALTDAVDDDGMFTEQALLVCLQGEPWQDPRVTRLHVRDDPPTVAEQQEHGRFRNMAAFATLMFNRFDQGSGAGADFAEFACTLVAFAPDGDVRAKLELMYDALAELGVVKDDEGLAGPAELIDFETFLAFAHALTNVKCAVEQWRGVSAALPAGTMARALSGEASPRDLQAAFATFANRLEGPEERDQARAFFDALDANHDGWMSRAEFVEAAGSAAMGIATLLSALSSPW